MKKNSERICFILNPSAGRTAASEKVDWLKKQVDEIWSDYEICIAASASELSSIAKAASIDFDTIVACGGDGTINRIVNSISGRSCRIGVIPMGSGNDFSEAIGLPADLDVCLEIIKTGKTRSVDVIRITGDAEILCVNTLGIGLDGWANYYASTADKLRGQLVYVYGILKAVYNFRGCMMRLKAFSKVEGCRNAEQIRGETGQASGETGQTSDIREQASGSGRMEISEASGEGEEGRGPALQAYGCAHQADKVENDVAEPWIRELKRQILMVTVCNGPEEGGGFKVAPDADNADGWMDVLIIDKLPVPRILWYLPKFLLQPGRKLKGVNRIRCKELILESDESVAVHCDGEFAGSHLKTIRAGIMQGYLTVIVP